MYRVLEKNNRKAIIQTDNEGYIIEELEANIVKSIRLLSGCSEEYVYNKAKYWVEEQP